MFANNKAVGYGANPQSGRARPAAAAAAPSTPTVMHYNVTIAGTLMHYNHAREGGSAIFFVVDAKGGTLTIRAHSRLNHNPRGTFQNAPGIFDSVNGHVTAPTIINSSVR